MEGGKRSRGSKRKHREEVQPEFPATESMTPLDAMMIQLLMEEELGKVEDNVQRYNTVLWLWRQLKKGQDKGISPSRIFKLKRPRQSTPEPAKIEAPLPPLSEVHVPSVPAQGESGISVVVSPPDYVPPPLEELPLPND